MRTQTIHLACVAITAIFTHTGLGSEQESTWYDTFDYYTQEEVEEFWINSPGKNPPTLVRDPKQGDGHMLRVSAEGSLVGRRTGPATNWWAKVHRPDELVNYQGFGIRNADDTKHVLLYFDQPEPESVRVDIRGGEERLLYTNKDGGAAQPSAFVTGMAGLWHFHVSKEDGVTITLDGQEIFHGGPEYAFEADDMVFVFESHYGGPSVDFEFISTQEP